MREERRQVRRSQRRLALAALVFLLLLAAGAGRMVGEGKFAVLLGTGWSDRPLQLGMVQQIKSLDPAVIQDRAGRLVGFNVYEGLVGLDPRDLSPVPALAESWRVSDDGRVYTFKLRRGVRFHSGRQLAAQDVKRSWERVLDPALGSGLRYLLAPIQGVREAVEGKTAQVEGIEVVNDRELRVTLEQPNAGFLSRLAMPPFWVFDCEALPAGKPAYAAGMPAAGTGPLMLEGWRDKELTLAANPAYWGRKPLVGRAVFTWFDSAAAALEAFQQGRIDYLDEVPATQLKSLEADPKWGSRLVRQPLLDSYFYQINLQHPVWGSSVQLRQALNYAVDREALIEKLFNGAAAPLQSLVPAGFRGYQPPGLPYRYNPKLAGELLAAAGYPGGQGLPPLEIAYNSLAAHRVVAEAVKEQLARAGIRVELRPVAWKDYKSSLAQGRFACFRGGWSWDYPDPDDLFFYNFHSSQTGANNFCFLRHAEVDRLLGAARAETGNDRRRFDYYRQAERIIIEESPLIWLFSWQRVAMVNPAVQGLKINYLDLIALQPVGIRE